MIPREWMLRKQHLVRIPQIPTRPSHPRDGVIGGTTTSRVILVVGTDDHVPSRTQRPKLQDHAGRGRRVGVRVCRCLSPTTPLRPRPPRVPVCPPRPSPPQRLQERIRPRRSSDDPLIRPSHRVFRPEFRFRRAPGGRRGRTRTRRRRTHLTHTCVVVDHSLRCNHIGPSEEECSAVGLGRERELGCLPRPEFRAQGRRQGEHRVNALLVSKASVEKGPATASAALATATATASVATTATASSKKKEFHLPNPRAPPPRPRRPRPRRPRPRPRRRYAVLGVTTEDALSKTLFPLDDHALTQTKQEFPATNNNVAFHTPIRAFEYNVWCDGSGDDQVLSTEWTTGKR